jgi:Flp pilus assembly protein TadG
MFKILPPFAKKDGRNHLTRRKRSFWNNSDGNVAILFGLALIAALGAIGIAIDYSRAAMVRTRLQSGTDAAILAISKQYTDNPNLTQAQLTTYALNFLSAVTTDPNATIDYASSGNDGSNTGNSTSGLYINGNTICLSTKSISNGTLSKVIGLTSAAVHAISCTALAVGKVYEIAMALDNTGSMAEVPTGGGTSKMTALQTAAHQLVTIMNPTASSPRAAISVVPFASAVNIGSQYQTASFMDSAGKSSIHWQNYSSPSGAKFAPTSRFDLFTGMSASWSGCVEERPVPYLTTDTPASTSTPDTLYVPFLAPDDPGTAVGAAQFSYNNQTDWSFNSYLDDNGGTCATSNTVNQSYVSADAGSGNIYSSANANTPRGTGGTKLCKYSGQKVANVNSAVSGVNGGSGLFPAGPNLGCTAAPLQILTTDNSAINAKISAMAPNGDTNLLAGFMWGWRTISPNGPFTGQANATVGPQDPVAYSNTKVKKIIIFMTDGFDHWVANPYSPYQSMYSSLGFYFNGRVSSYGSNAGATNSTNYRSQMDAAFLEACTNAKAAGVMIYTVGFSVSSDPIDTQGISTLQGCASSASNAYIATNSSEIISTFQAIANAINKLRLSK